MIPFFLGSHHLLSAIGYTYANPLIFISSSFANAFILATISKKQFFPGYILNTHLFVSILITMIIVCLFSQYFLTIDESSKLKKELEDFDIKNQRDKILQTVENSTKK